LFKVHHFRHPRERVFGAGVQFGEADLATAAVGDEFHVFVHHRGVQAEYAAGHGVVGGLDFQMHGFVDHGPGFGLEYCGPQVRVFDLDLVDDVDAEVQVDRFVAHDVLHHFGGAGHFVATPE